MAFIDKEIKNNDQSEDFIYDCIVIGTGTSSEPVIYHLSKTNLKTLVIDQSNLNKEFKNIDRLKKNYLSNITPKQIFSELKVHNSNDNIDLAPNAKLSCTNFSYIYANISGGLSNFWGGGLFNWPESEIKKTTSLPYSLIKDSYKKISKRLNILDRNQFLKKSSFSNAFLDINYKKRPNIFQPAKFFISKKGLENQRQKREFFDQNLIWKSSDTIRNYINTSKNIVYLPHTKALSIKKQNSLNIICCMKNNKISIFKSRAIFLCAGVINSTYLAFSSLNDEQVCLKLNHSFAAIVPIVFLGSLGRFNKDNIELPDLAWSLLSKNINISGYILSSYFLHNLWFRFFNRPFLKRVYKLIEKLISSIAFVTVFTDSISTNTTLKIKRVSNTTKKVDDFFISIENHNSSKDKKRYISRKLNKLNKFINGRFFLIRFMVKYAANGGDIHYGSTMPDENITINNLNTTSIGEIKRTKNIYICDASRMAYISSLPHTFTSMAIVDASMPLIIKKLV